MVLKGKTTFELTNVETGEKRVVEENNLITNAFAELVKGVGVYGNAIYRLLNESYSPTMSKNNNSKHFIRRFAGGLVLFEDNLEENADHMYLTAEDPEVVGVGVDYAYAGEQLCAGSYNTAESGEIENGYRHVWDFNTSQGNGNIGCACLTNIEGASMGLTGFSTYIQDWKGDFLKERLVSGNTSLPHPVTYDYLSNTSRYRMYIDETRNILILPKNAYSIVNDYTTSTSTIMNEYDINGKVLTNQKKFERCFLVTKSIDFDIYRYPFTNMSIFDNFSSESKSMWTSDTSTNLVTIPKLRLLDTVTVKMPDELAAVIPSDKLSTSTNWHWKIDVNQDEGFMYLSFSIPDKQGSHTNDSIKPNDKFYVWKINMDTFESTWFTITNTTGQTITHQYGDIKRMYISNNYTLLLSKDSDGVKMWTIENSNNANVKQVKTVAGDVYKLNFTNITGFVINDIVYLYEATTASSTRTWILVINMKTGIVKFISLDSLGNLYYVDNITHGTKFPKLVMNLWNFYSSWDFYMYFYLNPMYLFTINNLSTPVTKTSAETMKVTYTLTMYDESLEEPSEP